MAEHIYSDTRLKFEIDKLSAANKNDQSLSTRKYAKRYCAYRERVAKAKVRLNCVRKFVSRNINETLSSVNTTAPKPTNIYKKQRCLSNQIQPTVISRLKAKHAQRKAVPNRTTKLQKQHRERKAFFIKSLADQVTTCVDHVTSTLCISDTKQNEYNNSVCAIATLNNVKSKVYKTHTSGITTLEQLLETKLIVKKAMTGAERVRAHRLRKKTEKEIADVNLKDDYKTLDNEQHSVSVAMNNSNDPKHASGEVAECSNQAKLFSSSSTSDNTEYEIDKLNSLTSSPITIEQVKKDIQRLKEEYEAKIAKIAAQFQAYQQEIAKEKTIVDKAQPANITSEEEGKQTISTTSKSAELPVITKNYPESRHQKQTAQQLISSKKAVIVRKDSGWGKPVKSDIWNWFGNVQLLITEKEAHELELPFYTLANADDKPVMILKGFVACFKCSAMFIFGEPKHYNLTSLQNHKRMCGRDKECNQIILQSEELILPDLFNTPLFRMHENETVMDEDEIIVPQVKLEVLDPDEVSQPPQSAPNAIPPLTNWPYNKIDRSTKSESSHLIAELLQTIKVPNPLRQTQVSSGQDYSGKSLTIETSSIAVDDITPLLTPVVQFDSNQLSVSAVSGKGTAKNATREKRVIPRRPNCILLCCSETERKNSSAENSLVLKKDTQSPTLELFHQGAQCSTLTQTNFHECIPSLSAETKLSHLEKEVTSVSQQPAITHSSMETLKSDEPSLTPKDDEAIENFILPGLRTRNICLFDGVASASTQSNQFDSDSSLNHLCPDGTFSDDHDRSLFLDKLVKFHKERGTDLTQFPTINKQPVDLYQLYCKVKEQGGFDVVMRLNSWKGLATTMGIGSSSSVSFCLKRQYVKHLFAFECKYDRGGIDPEPIINDLLPNLKKYPANKKRVKYCDTIAKHHVSDRSTAQWPAQSLLQSMAHGIQIATEPTVLSSYLSDKRTLTISSHEMMPLSKIKVEDQFEIEDETKGQSNSAEVVISSLNQERISCSPLSGGQVKSPNAAHNSKSTAMRHMDSSSDTLSSHEIIPVDKIKVELDDPSEDETCENPFNSFSESHLELMKTGHSNRIVPEPMDSSDDTFSSNEIIPAENIKVEMRDDFEDELCDDSTLSGNHTNDATVETSSPKAMEDILELQNVDTLFNTEQYFLMFQIMQHHAFDKRYHQRLQNKWFEAHYAIVQKTRSRQLGPVDRYRIRKRFPPPPTIWDGELTLYSFTAKSRSYLNREFKLHRYPSNQKKKQLAEASGLSISQVSNWFKNKRQRHKDMEEGIDVDVDQKHEGTRKAGRPRLNPSAHNDSQISTTDKKKRKVKLESHNQSQITFSSST